MIYTYIIIYVYNTYTYVHTHIYAHTYILVLFFLVPSGNTLSTYTDIGKMGLNPSPMPPGHRLVVKHLISMGYSCRLSLEWKGRIQAFGLGTKNISLIIFVLCFCVLLVSQPT